MSYQHSSALLPYSSPSPHHTYPPNAGLCYDQARYHSPTFNNRIHSSNTDGEPTNQPHTVYHRENASPATSCTKPWISDYSLKPETDAISYATDNESSQKDLGWNGQGQHAAQSHQSRTLTGQTAMAECPAYNMVQVAPMVYVPSATTKKPSHWRQDTHRSASPAYSSHKLPHLPGATQYLQYRSDRTDPVQGTARNSADAPHDSLVQVCYREHARKMSANHERSPTVQSPQQPFMTANAAANGMSSHPPESSNLPAKHYALDRNSPRGTQDAPLEILSSPEPRTKRRKIANSSQAACQKLHEALNITKTTSDDGSPREAIAEMLTKSTHVKPRKTWHYAVAIGRNPGVYRDWPAANKSVEGFPGAKHKKFKTEEEALAYVEQYGESTRKLAVLPIGGRHAPRIPEYEQCPRYVQAAQSIASNSYDSGYNSIDTSYELASFGIPSPQQIESPYPPTEPPEADMEKDFIPLDDEPKLVPEQQHVVDLIVQGHNVFYTGSAGCGKSTILKAFVKRLQRSGKKVKIIAPTNLAALNVGGQTTWSFAGWTPDSMSTDIETLMQKALGKEVWARFNETDVLVIDEISMVENLQFERLNMVMKAARNKGLDDRAFGGVQLIVTGDVSLSYARWPGRN